MQTLIQDLSAKQIHEDSQAAKKDRQPEIEKLEYSGEDDGILREVVTFLDMSLYDLSLCDLDKQVIDSIGIVVTLVRNELDPAGFQGPRFVPMKKDWRFSQLRAHVLARHARLHREKIQMGQRLFISAGELPASFSLVGRQHSVCGEEKQWKQRQDVDPQASPRK